MGSVHLQDNNPLDVHDDELEQSQSKVLVGEKEEERKLEEDAIINFSNAVNNEDDLLHGKLCDECGVGGRAFKVREMLFCSPSCANAHFKLSHGDDDYWSEENEEEDEEDKTEGNEGYDTDEKEVEEGGDASEQLQLAPSIEGKLRNMPTFAVPKSENENLNIGRAHFHLIQETTDELKFISRSHAIVKYKNGGVYITSRVSCMYINSKLVSTKHWMNSVRFCWSSVFSSCCSWVSRI